MCYLNIHGDVTDVIDRHTYVSVQIDCMDTTIHHLLACKTSILGYFI